MSKFLSCEEELIQYDSPESVVVAIKDLYFSQTSNIRIISEKNVSSCALEMFTYPFLSAKINGKIYGSPIARPDLFENYYSEECARLGVPFFVSKSRCPMPLAFIDEDLSQALTPEQMVFRKITSLSIEAIEESHTDDIKPLNWFNAPRIDYSLNRILHYTGSDAAHMQDYVIFVNYQKYIPAFLEYAKNLVINGNASDIVGPDNLSFVENMSSFPPEWNDAALLPQMPAYHIKKSDKSGISIINIGVGPSNAKTIMDHVAVLRPRYCLMLGHCGSLMEDHKIGDYIFGDAHLMFDFDDFSNSSCSSASYCNEAVGSILTKTKFHLGPVVSTSDRNWELRSSKVSELFKQFGAIGIDMESAMIVQIAENYGIPAGSLLCVSDKPLHREIRMQKMAKEFYRTRLQNHLLDAISIMESFAGMSLRKRFEGDIPLFR